MGLCSIDDLSFYSSIYWRRYLNPRPEQWPTRRNDHQSTKADNSGQTSYPIDLRNYLDMNEQEAFRWLLDVKDLWPIPDEQLTKTQSTAHWASGSDAARALSLLPAAERARVLRFYHPRDAKLCLGSNLLKHRAISHACQVSWDQATISEDRNHKPCYKPTEPKGLNIEFNVSHHGTLVSLVGCASSIPKLGTDIVQVSWEKDYAAIQKDGFKTWVNIYEAVFSDREVADIIAYTPAMSDPQAMMKAKLRHFYAHWCLREAYVKMTGEALLAPWLKDLEFRNVKVPPPASHVSPEDGDGGWGQVCTDYDIWFKSKKVTNVKMELQAFGEDYMIATAISESNISLLPFKKLNIQVDIYP